MVWRRSSARQNGDVPSPSTTIELVDARNRLLAKSVLDLAVLHAKAESTSSARDPIVALTDAILAYPDFAEIAVSRADRLSLESALTTAAVQGQWPNHLAVRGTKLTNAKKHFAPGQPDLATLALFDEQLQFPYEEAAKTYDGLVGLDGVKSRLVKEAVLLTRPNRLAAWSRAHHAKPTLQALSAFRGGAPFLIFAGDVGTGKTALATSFGDAVARELGEQVNLLKMSVQTRGSGIVGDMTRQITNAFLSLEQDAKRTGRVTILLLDEADSLSESRETQQMHHEDRAGVNALIQGVDRLRGGKLPVLIVFCTNRVDAIDPAIRRRAADIIEFARPNEMQRREHITRLFGDLGLSAAQIEAIVCLTGPREGRSYGFTYSDIADRLARQAVLSAFPDSPLGFELLKEIAASMVPTRPFGVDSRPR
jgi:SpoVK/Ycf46/Vps4 family AAA+-type ATPase